MEQIRQKTTCIICALLLLLALAAAAFAVEPPRGGGEKVTLHFFWGEGCPHCAEAEPFLDGLAKKYPALQIRSYEVYNHPENVDLLMTMARERGKEAKSVPTVILGKAMIAGFNEDKAAAIESEVRAQLQLHVQAAAGATPPREGNDAVTLPLFGRLDPEATSLPVFTALIAALDSFNPCAFFVLLFLLSLLIHAHSRVRMALVGGTFVFFSGFVYFIFMAAWLNIFLLAGTMKAVTVAAGVVALVVAALNIKDFFLFEKGVSLVIPEGKKPKLFERMRNLVRSESLPAMLTGTVVLAAAANSYELLCTAGFPMVFTRVLTLKALPQSIYYLYLALYNVIYMIPLAIIVAIFTATLGSRKLSEWQGRVLKLLSGIMMLMLGGVILLSPSLLNSATAAVVLLG
ncbi:MAG TPA: thioredoxin family protein, partial [Geobacteraceae bacterium]|nr:thioredoxin family protein [Geobacteraceae bacterium]